MKLILVLLLLPISAFAFNSTKCKATFWDTKGHSYITKATAKLLNISTSSGQYLSSTGNCSALAQELRREEFYRVNSDKIKSDIARGQGEYADAFAELYECDLVSRQLWLKSLKLKYDVLLKLEDEKKIFRFLDNELLSIKKEGPFRIPLS